MGVLNFSGSLRYSCGGQYDILSLDAAEDHVIVEEGVERNNNVQRSPSRTKRKRTKSSGGCYDFREHGVDARRRGVKHQRRKQNFCDLLQMAEDEGVDDDAWLDDVNFTAFAELFMDEEKMKIWEGFMNLPEDKQRRYLEQHTSTAQNHEDHGYSNDMPDEDAKYLLVDKKIRDILRSKKLAYDGLLRYYEDDMISCMEEWFNSILVLNLDDKYDRMLVYGICQYMGLSWNTIKLKNATMLEVDLTNNLKAPDITLSKYLQMTKTVHN